DESFARILKGLLQKYDRLFDKPLPYVMAMHQKPPSRAGRQHHLHVEFYPPNRTRDKLKYLAGSELGAGAFILDARAEDTAGLQPDIDGKEAALACQRAEQKATGVHVGVMDQFASALGRRGGALLLDCATLEYEVVPFPDEVAIAVIDSGEHRSLADTPYNQ